MKYTFSNDQNGHLNNYLDITFFYQLSRFENTDKKHHMRQFIINPDNSLKGYYDYYLTKNKVDKFLVMKLCNEYKIFNVSDLSSIPHPSDNDIMLRRSEMF